MSYYITKSNNFNNLLSGGNGNDTLIGNEAIFLIMVLMRILVLDRLSDRYILLTCGKKHRFSTGFPQEVDNNY